MIANSSVGTRPGQIASMTSTPQVSSGSMDIVPVNSRPTAEKKASVYAEVVKNLNRARQSGLPFKVCTLFSRYVKLKIRVLYLIKNLVDGVASS